MLGTMRWLMERTPGRRRSECSAVSRFIGTSALVGPARMTSGFSRTESRASATMRSRVRWRPSAPRSRRCGLRSSPAAAGPGGRLRPRPRRPSRLEPPHAPANSPHALPRCARAASGHAAGAAPSRTDKCAPLHSITSSARASRIGAGFRGRAPCAVLEVDDQLEARTGCVTGRSAGFGPAGTLPT